MLMVSQLSMANGLVRGSNMIVPYNTSESDHDLPFNAKILQSPLYSKSFADSDSIKAEYLPDIQKTNESLRFSNKVTPYTNQMKAIKDTLVTFHTSFTSSTPSYRGMYCFDASLGDRINIINGVFPYKKYRVVIGVGTSPNVTIGFSKISGCNNMVKNPYPSFFGLFTKNMTLEYRSVRVRGEYEHGGEPWTPYNTAGNEDETSVIAHRFVDIETGLIYPKCPAMAIGFKSNQSEIESEVINVDQGTTYISHVGGNWRYPGKDSTLIPLGHSSYYNTKSPNAARGTWVFATPGMYVNNDIYGLVGMISNYPNSYGLRPGDILPSDLTKPLPSLVTSKLPCMITCTVGNSACLAAYTKDYKSDDVYSGKNGKMYYYRQQQRVLLKVNYQNANISELDYYGNPREWVAVTHPPYHRPHYPLYGKCQQECNEEVGPDVTLVGACISESFPLRYARNYAVLGYGHLEIVNTENQDTIVLRTRTMENTRVTGVLLGIYENQSSPFTLIPSMIQPSDFDLNDCVWWIHSIDGQIFDLNSKTANKSSYITSTNELSRLAAHDSDNAPAWGILSIPPKWIQAILKSRNVDGYV